MLGATPANFEKSAPQDTLKMGSRRFFALNEQSTWN